MKKKTITITEKQLKALIRKEVKAALTRPIEVKINPANCHLPNLDWYTSPIKRVTDGK